ncbi:MAG: hypothetical protein ACTSQP_24270 [Promethearchaeota archaeon]
MTKSKIPKIKRELWELLIFYLKNYNKNFNVFSDDKGRTFLKNLSSNKLIAEFQWIVQGNYKYSLLEIYCSNFLSKDFINSNELRELFDIRFKRLEKEVLLSDSFEYLIIIPTFRIYFSKDKREIILDNQHKIRNIHNIEKPYGGDLPKFKQPPKYWYPFNSVQKIHNQANSSIEVKFRIRKKKAIESYYRESKFVPTAPLSRNFSNYDQFDEKVLSIHDFFLCFSKEEDFRPFTFGSTYYIKLPPFSQDYKYLPKTLIYQFSHPEGFLDLKEENNIDFWINCWRENYEDFYKSFYTLKSKKSFNIFRYSLETIRIVQNIPFITMQNFLLISTLEGLTFISTINNRINKKSKRNVMSEVFIKISADRKKRWRYLVSENYFQDNEFDQLSHDDDIKKFINSAYEYRNNIAHPEEKKEITFKPEYFYNNNNLQRCEYILSMKIFKWFKKFIRFLLTTWVEKKIKNQDDWYKYIESLF